jgi:hypothetical protein
MNLVVLSFLLPGTSAVQMQSPTHSRNNISTRSTIWWSHKHTLEEVIFVPQTSLLLANARKIAVAEVTIIFHVAPHALGAGDGWLFRILVSSQMAHVRSFIPLEDSVAQGDSKEIEMQSLRWEEFQDDTDYDFDVDTLDYIFLMPMFSWTSGQLKVLEVVKLFKGILLVSASKSNV